MRHNVTGPVIVTSRERAAELMMSTTTRPTIKAVISICDTSIDGIASSGARRPAGLRDIEHRLCLTFDDVTDATSADRFGYIPPERKDIERILAFGRTHDFTGFLDVRASAQARGRFLIHCHAGVSRSTATALMLFAQAHGRGYEDASISCLVSACESTPVPNELMIQYADEILGREGRLIRALKNFMLDSYGHKGMY